MSRRMKSKMLLDACQLPDTMKFMVHTSIRLERKELIPMALILIQQTACLSIKEQIHRKPDFHSRLHRRKDNLPFPFQADHILFR